MSDSQGNAASKALSDEELADLVASTDTGARGVSGSIGVLLAAVAFVWSLFQLWIASPLPFLAQSGLGLPVVLNNTETRSIHLAFALFLAFTAFPAPGKPRAGSLMQRLASGLIVGLALILLGLLMAGLLGSEASIGGALAGLVSEPRYFAPALALLLVCLATAEKARDRVPLLDWVLALGGAFCGAYLYLFYAALTGRPGLPTWYDLTIAGIGLVMLLEATRRSLGPPLMIVALVFLAYVFFGNSPVFPEVIQWKGASVERAMSHMYLTTEGVFGVALGVSSSFVFLFVLFGSLLDKGGAGNYFIKLAFALLGHLRGGPAKAAVLASAMTGLISGSSIANVVTTGTFTIPLMRRVGFTPERAGAVEVGSSVNGQIMPPVMGAAAFLMVEYVGISYAEVVKHAFLPAAISYIALLYLVHLEALKQQMQALPKSVVHPLKAQLLRTGIIVSSIFILAGVTYYGLRGIQALVGDVAWLPVVLILGAIYLGLIWLAARDPDLQMDDPDAKVVKLPVAGEVVRTGLYYLLPIVVLVWFLMVELKSPGLSAFWATTLMIVILLTQRPLKAFFRGTGSEIAQQSLQGVGDLVAGMIAGARNMIGIAVATAAAGIIVGTVTLTGIGQVMAEFVEFISGGSLMLILVFTALISLILGMGLPTTANYIVVSSLMAPVVVELGAANGLIVPLIAVHLFVFYYGIMADVTPPVGLASFAAAAVSGGDPIRTGFTAFFYSLRTVILPFLFIFNTDLLLIDVDLTGAILIFIKATIAMLIFAAATQGYFFARSRIWESAVLLLVAFTLFRPGYWLDQVQPPFDAIPAAQVFDAIESKPEEAQIRLRLEGPDFQNFDEIRSLTLAFDIGPPDGGAARLEAATGLALALEDGQLIALDEPLPGAPNEAQWREFDFYGDTPVTVTEVLVPAERLPKEVFYIPALLLLVLVILVQRRRATVPAF
ncbi:TRAP transporter permease [Algihabitans albus]|uniref:TRAP transporter permease n=1 Tax=Algihabitans albus TaxID=2164067 RepID=UPI000E5C846F|nr:TRAP transporter permease [Algihabitans albus]